MQRGEQRVSTALPEVVAIESKLSYRSKFRVDCGIDELSYPYKRVHTQRVLPCSLDDVVAIKSR